MPIRQFLICLACLMASLSGCSQSSQTTDSANNQNSDAYPVPSFKSQDPRVQAEWDQLEKDDFTTLQKKAKANNPRAQLILGNRYLCQFNNQEKAFHWMEKSADQNLPQAQLILGMSYLPLGKSEEGMILIEKAAENGLSTAQTILAGLIRDGIYTQKNRQRAFYWDQRSANQGISISQQSIPTYLYTDNMELNEVIRYKWEFIALENPETQESEKQVIKKNIKEMELDMSQENIKTAIKMAKEFSTKQEIDDQYLPTCKALIEK